MPAGAVASPPWADGSWSATCWESGVWGDSPGVFPAGIDQLIATVEVEHAIWTLTLTNSERTVSTDAPTRSVTYDG